MAPVNVVDDTQAIANQECNEEEAVRNVDDVNTEIGIGDWTTGLVSCSSLSVFEVTNKHCWEQKCAFTTNASH